MPGRKRTRLETNAENMESPKQAVTSKKRQKLNEDEKANEPPDPQHNTDCTDDKDKSSIDIFGGKDPRKLTGKELKALCKANGLKVSGNKTALITRLVAPSSAANRKGGRRLSTQQVDGILRNAGIEDPEAVNKCLKRGIQRGYYVVNGADSLDQVILESHCIYCSRKLQVTIKDALYQSSVGDDYEDGSEGGGVQCAHCADGDEGGMQYITRLCEGKPSLDCGKFHNHCEECPGFGKCIGDYREAHCDQCGKHWFTGLSGFPCSCQEQEGSDDLGIFSSFFRYC